MLIDGGNEKAWDKLTSDTFVSALIAFVVAIIVVILVRVWRAPITLAKARIAESLDRQRQLQSRLEAADRAAQSANPLESWLQSSLDEAKQLERQRSVRGDDWYFDAMQDWDSGNVHRLGLDVDALAPELYDQYRANPETGGVDGIQPPHTTAERERYYEARVTWIETTLAKLHAGETEPDPVVPEAHRRELQLVATGLLARLPTEQRSVYAPSTGDGNQAVAQSFRIHFPTIARLLDERDERRANRPTKRSGLGMVGEQLASRHTAAVAPDDLARRGTPAP